MQAMIKIYFEVNAYGFYGNATILHLINTGAGFENYYSSSKPTVMLPESILQSDVLDILFENRNKEYGAYTLRREYDAHMRKAMVITFSSAALLLLLAFSFKHKNNIARASLPPDIFIAPTPPPNKKKPDAPKKHQNILLKKTIHAVAALTLPTKTMIVQDNLADRNIPKLDELLKKNMADIKTDGPENINQQNIVSAGADGSNGRQSGTGTLTNEQNITGPIINPDVYPEFPGGKEALLRFLKRNLTDPKGVEDEQAISVRVRFVVNADGSISDFEVVESGGDDFDKEVQRVLKKMPHWTPGKSNGNDVSVYFEVPVKFIPDNNDQP